MILLIFIIGLAFQITAYRYFTKRKIRYGCLLTLLVILVLYGFVLPRFFLPAPPPDGQAHCGMPALAIYSGFWILGGGLTILTHLIYFVVSKNRN